MDYEGKDIRAFGDGQRYFMAAWIVSLTSAEEYTSAIPQQVKSPEAIE